MTHIIGHETVKKRLQKLVALQRVPHLLLFSGQEGIGKKLLAKWFAALWLSFLAQKPISESHPDISCITS